MEPSDFSDCQYISYDSDFMTHVIDASRNDIVVLATSNYTFAREAPASTPGGQSLHPHEVWTQDAVPSNDASEEPTSHC